MALLFERGIALEQEIITTVWDVNFILFYLDIWNDSNLLQNGVYTITDLYQHSLSELK